MMPVTALSAYLFCPRKMYMQYVLEIKPIEVDRLVKGEIKHNIFDRVNKAEEELVKKISPENINEIGMMYKQEYYKSLMETIEQKDDIIKKVGIDKSQLLEETWKRLMQEAELRTKNITEFALQNQLFGKELWENLKPKYITELSVTSTKLKLRGRIDRVEINEENYVPIELKTGTMPINGMWPGDKIQLGAYILMLQQKYKAWYGFLEYTEHEARRRLEMDEPLKENVIKTVEDVHITVESRNVPKKCENENKCIKCQMKENCEGIKEYVSEEGKEFF